MVTPIDRLPGVEEVHRDDLRSLLVCHIALHEALDDPSIPETGPRRGQLGEVDQGRHAVLADLIKSVVGKVDKHFSCTRSV